VGRQADRWVGSGNKLRRSLAFVTVRALLGIELISRDAKDVVALDADAVEENLRRLGRLSGAFGGSRNWSVGSLTHRGILS
jgi:hypothetical protein